MIGLVPISTLPILYLLFLFLFHVQDGLRLEAFPILSSHWLAFSLPSSILLILFSIWGTVFSLCIRLIIFQFVGAIQSMPAHYILISAQICINILLHLHSIFNKFNRIATSRAKNVLPPYFLFPFNPFPTL